MLESDYTERFGRLIENTPWEISLPQEWGDFFEQDGDCDPFASNGRRHRRIRVRSYGLLFFERSWPALQRPSDPLGLYTKDFSQKGCGIITGTELFPEEIARIVLATFWMHVKIARCQRIADGCYVVGCELIRSYEPADLAFIDAKPNDETPLFN